MEVLLFSWHPPGCRLLHSPLCPTTSLPDPFRAYQPVSWPFCSHPFHLHPAGCQPTCTQPTVSGPCFGALHFPLKITDLTPGMPYETSWISLSYFHFFVLSCPRTPSLPYASDVTQVWFSVIPPLKTPSPFGASVIPWMFVSDSSCLCCHQLSVGISFSQRQAWHRLSLP